MNYTWEGAAERLQRMAARVARSDEAWLRSLSVEESIRIFEDLCRGIPEIPLRAERAPPPVVLFRIWRS
jgi:hypothetical protein